MPVQIEDDFAHKWSVATAAFMTPYSFCGSFSDFGSWGHLEYLNQPLGEAHKHRALVDWAVGSPPVTVDPVVSYSGISCQNLWMGHWGEARVGQSLFVNVSGAPVFGSGALLLSGSNSDFAGIPLPVDASAFGVPGCWLQVGEFVEYPAQASAQGTMFQELQIPANAGLVGVTFHTQWSVNLPGFGALGLGLSNAISVTIGS